MRLTPGVQLWKRTYKRSILWIKVPNCWLQSRTWLNRKRVIRARNQYEQENSRLFRLISITSSLYLFFSPNKTIFHRDIVIQVRRSRYIAFLGLTWFSVLNSFSWSLIKLYFALSSLRRARSFFSSGDQKVLILCMELPSFWFVNSSSRFSWPSSLCRSVFWCCKSPKYARSVGGIPELKPVET